MIKTADVVVISVGVNGSGIAYHLAKAGVKRIAILERDYVASGPTGRSVGIVRQHCTVESLARMAEYSARVFQEFPDQIGGSAGFRGIGYLAVGGPEIAPALQRTVEMQQRIGINSRLVMPQEIEELAPGIFCRRFDVRRLRARVGLRGSFFDSKQLL